MVVLLKGNIKTKPQDCLQEWQDAEAGTQRAFASVCKDKELLTFQPRYQAVTSS